MPAFLNENPQAHKGNDIHWYDYIGDNALKNLVRDFYGNIKHDALLRPMYPGDLQAAERRLFLFLIQYLGGPQTYNEERGHPRLRKRHMVFQIDSRAKDHWLKHMNHALEQNTMPEDAKVFLKNYFERTADFLRNT